MAKAKKWFSKGKAGMEKSKKVDKEAKERQQQRDEDRGPMRFWLESDSAAKVTFLDTPVFFYHEHNLKLGGRWHNYFTSAPAGTPVLLENGVLPIEKVGVGAKVYTHTGKLKKVLDTWAFETEKSLVSLDCSRVKIPFELTFDHRMFAVKAPSFGSGRLDRIRDFLKEAPLAEIQIGDLDPGDFVFIPLLKGEADETLSAEASWLLGLFAADGCKLGGKKIDGGVEITLSPYQNKEAQRAAKVLESFGWRCRIHIEGNCIRVQASSDPAVEIMNFFMDRCGGKASEKRLPSDVLFGTEEARKAALEGLITGDGYVNEDSGATAYTTISQRLAYQVFQLCLGLGIAPSLYSYTSRQDDGFERARFYIVSFPTSPEKGTYGAVLRNDGMLVRVNGLKKRKFTGTVFDITVEEDQSFLTGMVAVHNCLKDFDTCPACEDGDNSSYVVAGTVINHKEYKDRKGEEHKNQKMLFVAKGTARQRLLKQIEKREGDLKFCVYEMERGSKPTECNTGEQFDFLKRLTKAQLSKLIPKGEDESWLKPFDYEELLGPMDSDEFRKAIGGEAPVGSAGEEEEKEKEEEPEGDDDGIKDIDDLL